MDEEMQSLPLTASNNAISPADLHEPNQYSGRGN